MLLSKISEVAVEKHCNIKNKDSYSSNSSSNSLNSDLLFSKIFVEGIIVGSEIFELSCNIL